MKIQKNLKLAALGALILEKRNWLIYYRTKTIYVHSLTTMERLHTIKGVNNPGSICANEDESILYCVTTSNEFFSFDMAAWNRIDHFVLKESDVDKEIPEDDELEFSNIYYYDEEHLLAVTLACHEIMVIHLPSRKGTVVWKAPRDEEYSAERITYKQNTLYIDYRESVGNWVSESFITLTPIREDCSVKVIERLIGYDIVYMDKAGKKLLSVETDFFFFKKKQILSGF